MSMTLKLPYKRYVCQVSTGEPRLKSSYIDLMQQNLDAFESYELREVSSAPASLTDHDFTKATQFSDSYDAFKLTGNYNSTDMTEVAYAGFAAYRFTVPASAISQNANITSVKVPIYRDRFEKSGVRLRLFVTNSAQLTPSNASWTSIRSVGALGKAAQLAQTSVPYLTKSSPANGVVEFTFTQASKAYIWVVVMLEDYIDTWEMYNSKEQRLYAIEGSAMIGGDNVEVTFDADVGADADVYAHETEILYNGHNPSGGYVYTPQIFAIPENATNYMRRISVLRPDTGDTLETYVQNFNQMSSILYSRFRSGDGVVAETPITASIGVLEGLEQVLGYTGARLQRNDRSVIPSGGGSVTSDYCISLELEVRPRAIPFVAPNDWDVRAIDFMMSVAPVNETVQPGCTMIIWLARGKYIPAITEELARNYSLYAGTDVSGFEFIGRCEPGGNYNWDGISKLASPLERGAVSTLLLFPMISRPDDILNRSEWKIGFDGYSYANFKLKG